MKILVPDEWLRTFLKTNATQKQIADYLSLCGPSVEKIENSVYSIEVTTNRIDSASILGIAREANAILRQFGLTASLHSIKLPRLNLGSGVDYLEAKVDSQLCFRFTAVVVRGVKIRPSPNWLRERLLAVGVRPLNNVVDISNYIMHELGQPVHTFDYDKIMDRKMVLRASKRGEVLTTLDGKTHTLEGGDIVIEDGSGRLIDLAGIMGGKNSEVDAKTKNVLLFVQTYNPLNIRKTSMSLAQRTEAAELFEKGLDSELVTFGIARGIELFSKLTEGKPDKDILDIYPHPYTPKMVLIPLTTLLNKLGVEIPKAEISTILTPLGFEPRWKKDILEITVPSWRANDISIPEDIVEEVARIYGYHNLPSQLMQGTIPDPAQDTPFVFEKLVKDLLKGWGGIEVYTLSLVPKAYIQGPSALRLKNALGQDSEYLRTSLMASLVSAANQNEVEGSFHLFEMANVYLPRKNNLPEEKMTLAGIFHKTDFREAKGLIEALLDRLNVSYQFVQNEKKFYAPSRLLDIKSKGKKIGELGILEDENLIYYEFNMEELRFMSSAIKTFRPMAQYPAQVEDITLTLPERTRLGDVLGELRTCSRLVSYAELTDSFKNSYTFRVHFQHPQKTLTNEEVIEIRNVLLKRVREKFGAILKS